MCFLATQACSAMYSTTKKVIKIGSRSYNGNCALKSQICVIHSFLDNVSQKSTIIGITEERKVLKIMPTGLFWSFSFGHLHRRHHMGCRECKWIFWEDQETPGAHQQELNLFAFWTVVEPGRSLKAVPNSEPIQVFQTKCLIQSSWLSSKLYSGISYGSDVLEYFI